MTQNVSSSSDLVELLGGDAVGPEVAVERLAPAAACGRGSVVVVPDEAALRSVTGRAPSLVVAPRGLDLPEPPPYSVILVDDARKALALLSAHFDRRPAQPPGVHATALLDPQASLAEDVAIGPYSVVEAGVAIGTGSRIGASCSIGAGARIGRGCRLHAHVVLYDGVMLGDRVELHSGCVLGADGFGYAVTGSGARKIHHLGGVRIGDDVEIGANTSVDRGTLEPTVIGDRTKIDNHCQIGHNARVGSDCLIAGMTGVAGSVAIGDRAVLGGYVAVADHVTIGAGARIGGRAGVTKDVPAGETWAGFPAVPYRRWVRGLYLQGRLERIWQAVNGRRDRH